MTVVPCDEVIMTVVVVITMIMAKYNNVIGVCIGEFQSKQVNFIETNR